MLDDAGRRSTEPQLYSHRANPLGAGQPLLASDYGRDEARWVDARPERDEDHPAPPTSNREHRVSVVSSVVRPVTLM